MVDFTVNKLNQAAWLVYINGLEIPASSVEVRFGVWSIPTLTLTLIPHPILQRIGAEDRLQVALFYLDTHWNPSAPTFRLMGEFEVVGWDYTTSSRGRSVQLRCVSHMRIFEQLKFYFISSLQDIVSSASPAVATDGSMSSQVKLYYPASLFLEGLTSPESVTASDTSADVAVATDAYIKRPIDFVLNIFRAHLRPVSTRAEDERSVPGGSFEIPRSAASVPGKNFFARWFKTTSFHRRWAALPVFEDGIGEAGCFPLIKAVQDTNTLKALQQQIGQSVGASGSAWQLLQQVFGYMYMEVGVIPCPPAALTTKKTGVITSRQGGGSTRDKELTIPTFFVKPMCTFALPPTCNVIFPSMIKNFSTTEDYSAQPTRLYLGEQFISNIIAPKAGSVRNFVQELMVTGYPDGVRQRMKDLLTASPETSNKNFLLYAEEFFRGPVSTRLNAPPWMYMLAQQEQSSAKTATESERKIIGALGEESAAPLGALFDQYAKYEYFRARYAVRTGGLSLAWNPYVVPGFPVVVFDRETDGFDVMGYANTVTHTMNAGPSPQMSTQVGLTFVRTLTEFLGLLGEELSDDVVTDISPPEVIPEVREIFQILDQAQDLYYRLLYRGEPMQKSAVFNWKDMLHVRNQYGDVLDLEEEAWKLDPYITVSPKDEYKTHYNSYDDAMRFAARPACTLQEYIETWHGKSLAELLETGVVKGEYVSFYSPANDADKTKGAVFWGRIYSLIQGPGPIPGVDVSNVGPAPEYSGAGPGGNTFVERSTGMAETRRDWDKQLEEYRKIIRSEGGRIAPLT